MNQPPDQRQDALVPPRPNLGPEPWSGDGGLASLMLFSAVVAAGLIAFWSWNRRRGRKLAVPSPASASPVDESPEARLLALCEQLRGTLSSRFGLELQARTTEEIACDPRVRGLLGAERVERLTEFLHAGDRLKFAGRNAADGVVEQLCGYESWGPALKELPRPPRPANDRARRSPGDRSGRRSAGTRPRRPGA